MFSYCKVFLYITVNRYTICKLLTLISSSLVANLLYWFPVHNKGYLYEQACRVRRHKILNHAYQHICVLCLRM